MTTENRPTTSWRRLLARALFFAAAAAACLFFVTAWFFAGLIAAPSRTTLPRDTYPAEVRRWERERGAQPFTVRTADGLTLHGSHLRARPGNDRFVVMVHGYRSNRLEYRDQCAQWLALGFDVLLYDQRFCGASEGAFTTCGVRESEDLGAVVAEAHRRLGAGARGGLHGRSMGAAVVLLHAAGGAQVDFVVAECPFSSFERELLFRLEKDYRFIPALLREPLLDATGALLRVRYGFDLADAAPERNIGQVRVPVLFLVTAGDRYIPPAMTHELHAATRAPKQLRVFPHGDHGQAWKLFPQGYDAALKEFLAAHSPAAGAHH